MIVSHGVENGGTPVGDRKSLEQLAAQVNERSRQEYLAKCKQWKAEQERKSLANNAQSNG